MYRICVLFSSQSVSHSRCICCYTLITQVDGDGPDLSSQPVEDGATQTSSVREEFKARLREVRERFKDVPDRYKGYELLLDVQDDPHIKIPTSETVVVYSVSVTSNRCSG